jgi:capsular exopolysaccharide synthesis family protein
MLAESNRLPSSVPPKSPVKSHLSASQPSLTDRLFQICQRRKWAIAATALVTASGIWAWTLTRPALYQGQVQLLAAETEEDRAEGEGEAGSQPEGSLLEPRLIQNPLLLESTAASLSATFPQVTAQRLANHLGVTQDGQGMAVRYQGNSPAEVEAVLREVAQRYQAVAPTPTQVGMPTVGDRPVSPPIWKGLVLGAIAGLSLGATAAFFAEKLDRSFPSPDRLKAFTQLPMLGIIPFFKTLQPSSHHGADTSDALTELADYERSSFLEAFRSLYSNLRFLQPDRPVQSLVVSSAIPAEGKSTTALNLAKAAAVMGQRVLLVDADLRLPQIHTRLQIANPQGLSEVLAQGLPWRDLIQSALDENLQVLTAGQTLSDPVRLLSSAALQRFMQETQEAFDLVVYDMPPLLGFTDSGLVAPHTDGLALVVGLGTTTQVELKQALDQLEVMPVNVLGMVANGIRAHTTQAYNYDRYHRYYAQRASTSEALIAAPPAESPVISSEAAPAAPTDLPEASESDIDTAILESDLLTAVGEELAREDEIEIDEETANAAPASGQGLETSPVMEVSPNLEVASLEVASTGEPADLDLPPADLYPVDLPPLEIPELEVTAPGAIASENHPDSSDQTETPVLSDAPDPTTTLGEDHPPDSVSPAANLLSQVVEEMKAMVQTYRLFPSLLQRRAEAEAAGDESEPGWMVEEGAPPSPESTADPPARADSAAFTDQITDQTADSEPEDDRISDLASDSILPSEREINQVLFEDTVPPLMLDTETGEIADPCASRNGFALSPDLNQEVQAEAAVSPAAENATAENAEEGGEVTASLEDEPQNRPEPAAEQTEEGPALEGVSDADLFTLDTTTDTLADLERFLAEEDESVDPLESLADPSPNPLDLDPIDLDPISLDPIELDADLDPRAIETGETAADRADSSDLAMDPNLWGDPEEIPDDPISLEPMTLEPLAMDATHSLVTELSPEDLAHLGEAGVLSSLALPDETVLEMDEKQADEGSDEGLTEEVLELEAGELQELLSWDSPEQTPALSNPFERAVLAAQQAIRTGETTTTADAWRTLAAQWRHAAELMGQVPTADPNYEIAQRCQALYQSNSEYAEQKARSDTSQDDMAK